VTRLLKFAIFAAAFLAALLVGHHNARAATSERSQLGQPINLMSAVSQVAGRPISITVNNEMPGSWGGGAWPGLPSISIGRDAYTDAQDGGGHGLMVLLHELGHTTGITNEAAANCFALNHLIPFLHANWQTEQLDGWAYRFDPVATRYGDAVRSMLAQSAIYQCKAIA
jgi:hypothetical protein